MDGTSFRAARRSPASFNGLGLRNIELGIGHVVQEVREAAEHHAGDDLYNLGVTKACTPHSSKLLLSDLASTFQHIIGERQSGFRVAVFGVASATGENIVGSQPRRRSDRVFRIEVQ